MVIGIISSKSARIQIVNTFEKIDLGEMLTQIGKMVDEAWVSGIANSDRCERYYQVGKRSFDVISIALGVGVLIKVVKGVNLTSKIKKLGDVLEDTKQALKKLKTKGLNLYKLGKLSKNLKRKIREIKDLSKRDRLLDDIDRDIKLSKALDEKPELVDAWVRLDDIGADELLRRNSGVLDVMTRPKGVKTQKSKLLP